jgi:hypothetical protein
VIIASYKEILSYGNKFVKYFGNKNQINGDILFLWRRGLPIEKGSGALSLSLLKYSSKRGHA